jgi:hypothetical protein
VKRTAEFSDGVRLDDGSGLDKMEEVMKKSTMKSIKTSHAAPSPFLAGSCSFVTLFLFLLFIFFMFRFYPIVCASKKCRLVSDNNTYIIDFSYIIYCLLS